MKNVTMFKRCLWDNRGWCFRAVTSWLFIVVVAIGLVMDCILWCREHWRHEI